MYKKKFLLGQIYLFIIFISSVVTVFNQGSQEADEEIKKFEIGIHFSKIGFRTFDPYFTREWRRITPLSPDLPFVDPESNGENPGIGARFTYNFNKYVALEAEANWYFEKAFIEERPLINKSPYPGGQKVQVVGGPKIGHRWRKFGIFGKARPGFLHIVEYPVVTYLQQVPPGQPFLFRQRLQRANFFNIDLGGVFEYYPSKRTILRFDVGDTIVRYHAQEPRDINASFTKHNLQINVGFGFRF